MGLNVARLVNRAVKTGVPNSLRRDGLKLQELSREMDANGDISDVPVREIGTEWALTAEYDRRDIDGTQIQQGDLQLVFSVPAGDTPPDPDQDFKVDIDGRTYRVQDLKQVNPGGAAVMFEANLRR